jgi:group I intron endonuclease
LQSAFNKYGENNFEITILASVINPPQVRIIEQSFIEHYKSYDREYGYNKSKTASFTTCTEEMKANLRLKNTGKKYHPEINAKKGHKGKTNPFYGKHHNDTSLEKMVIGKGYKVAPFICIETGEIFKWFTEAARKTKSREATISECVKHGKFHVSNGLHFIYIEEIPFKTNQRDNHIILTEQQRAMLINDTDPRRKMFKCLQTNECFTSVNKASTKLKIRRSSISEQLFGKRTSSINGYNFAYV